MNTTKQVIANSLKRLLLKKPITKITIKDIAEDCGISRMTFYYHFQDIYDLAKWMTRQEAEEAMKRLPTLENWQEGLLSLLKGCLENKPLVMNVYRSVSREEVELYLNHVIDRLLMGVVQEASQGLIVTEADQRQVAAFYGHALVGTGLAWIQRDMQEAPEVIVENIALILEGDFRAALERLSRRH